MNVSKSVAKIGKYQRILIYPAVVVCVLLSLNPLPPSYLMLACVVGFYSLPGFRRLKPCLHDTSMTQTIGNCVVLLILSSALPVLSRILGRSQEVRGHASYLSLYHINYNDYNVLI